MEQIPSAWMHTSRFHSTTTDLKDSPVTADSWDVPNTSIRIHTRFFSHMPPYPPLIKSR